MSSGYTDKTPAYEWMVTTIEQATGMEFDGKGVTADGKSTTFRFYDDEKKSVYEYGITQVYALYETCLLKMKAQVP